MKKCLVKMRFWASEEDSYKISMFSMPIQVPGFLVVRLRKTRIVKREKRSTIVIEPVHVPNSVCNQIYKQLGLSMPFGEPHEQLQITKIIPDD